jgi:hypothetical protein
VSTSASLTQQFSILCICVGKLNAVWFGTSKDLIQGKTTEEKVEIITDSIPSIWKRNAKA